MKIESLGASLGMRWASLASLGIVLGSFGAFWSILENFLSFGLSSGGSQAAHDWGFNYWRIPGSTWVRWATLIHGGPQAAPSYPGILTGRRTFENFYIDPEFPSEFCHFLIFPIDSYSSVCTGMSSVSVCLIRLVSF